MASNAMYACVTCRVGGKNPYPACTNQGHEVIYFGKRITIPKKNNTRAWKRIEKGEYAWDRRKRHRANHRQGYSRYEKPEIDLGG
jgi:nitrate reductase beta subunit